jgi:hypothetical protein
MAGPLPVAEVRPHLAELVPGGVADGTGVVAGGVDRFAHVARQGFGQGPKVLSHPAYLIVGRHGLSL